MEIEDTEDVEVEQTEDAKRTENVGDVHVEKPENDETNNAKNFKMANSTSRRRRT